jgi:FtsP/CotA-like multicopper oxidase with cupredoxin domain
MKRLAVTHLHGAATVSPYDGWAEDTQITDQCKDYYYPNNAARGMWYHDHAIGKHCYCWLTTLLVHVEHTSAQ